MAANLLTMNKPLQLLLLLCTQLFSVARAQPSEFSAIYEANKHTVKIRCEPAGGTTAFVIQRSTDNRGWQDIALQQIGTRTTLSFTWYDKNPSAGENYYRIKYSGDTTASGFSKTVMVIANKEKNWVMFPVPVKDVLNLQYRGLARITGVIGVFIQSESGRILHRLRCASNNSLIQVPVSNLGRGIYDVRIVIENEIVWNQRFVK
jgi:hypothetical protein